MCGIFAYFGRRKSQELREYFQKIKHRGPDNSSFQEITSKLRFGFHRLAINGLDHNSDQPLHLGNCVLICNGEIYNYQKLVDHYGFDYQSHSDCEIILHLYISFGIDATLKMLDGVFAFILYDGDKNELFIARDKYGVRQLFYSFNMNQDNELEELAFASEAKALLFHDFISQFPPGTYWSTRDARYRKYFRLQYETIQYKNESTILEMIRRKLVQAVKKRTMSDRKIGALLSGGLDSSLIAGILVKLFPNPKDLETFSIGMEGSPDLKSAQEVANYLGTTHHSILCTEEEFLGALEKVIYVLGTYDVTTIRASVGHWLVCQYIRDFSEVKVLYSGEYADEQNLSYLYGINAPDPESFQKESIRLLKDIGYFDNLRGDHCISNAGLEARVPFADHDFMEFMMSIDPKLKMFNNSDRIEKFLIRKAFDKEAIIPREILWRRKNGFSDSVSQKTRSWSTIIQEYVDQKVSDQEFEENKDKFQPNPPLFKEAYYYRKVYKQYYPSKDYYLTPYQWLPKWCGEVVDPSARVLNIYQAD